MRTVALAMNKGGVGKSVLAVHLAACAMRKGKTSVLIDLDPVVESATEWGKRRKADDVTIVAARAHELRGVLASAKKQGADFVVSDPPGRADIAAMHAMTAADVVLVPCRPFINDILAAKKTAAEITG